MFSYHADEEYQKATSKNQLIGSSTTNTKLDDDAVNAPHMTAPTRQHDVSRVIPDDISISERRSHVFASYEKCTISCPVSPIAFRKSETEAFDKPPNSLAEWNSAIFGRSGELRYRQDDRTDSITTDTALHSLNGWLGNVRKSAAASFGQYIDKSSHFRDQHRWSELSTSDTRFLSRADYPILRRTKSLDSDLRSNESRRTCFPARKQICFVQSQPDADNERQVIAENREDSKRAYTHKGAEGPPSHMTVPSLVIQQTWDGKEYAFEHANSYHECKAEVIEVSGVGKEVSASCVTKSSMSEEKSSHDDSAILHAPNSDYQSLIRKLGIEVDLATFTCIGTTKKGLRCTLALSKSTRIEVRRALKKLVAIDLSKDHKTFLEQLELLAYMVLCKRYHQHSQATEVVSIWRTKLSCNVSEDVSPSFVGNILLPEKSISQTSEVNHKENTQDSVPRKVLLVYDADFNEHYTIRKLVPFDPKAKSSSNTGNFLQGVISRDLTPREKFKSGLIYIYWFPGNFGHLKIGVTTRDVKKRLKEWEEQCGHRPVLEYPRDPIDKQPVPHVFRVEALVQAELRSSRRTEVKCNTCGRSHREWFEKSLPDATAAVRKWSAWMRSQPYVEEMVQVQDYKNESMITRSDWKLKSEHFQNLQALCEQVPDIASVPSSSPYRRPRMGRPSSDPGASSNGSRTGVSRHTRSNLLKIRSKSGLPSDSTNYPHFSDNFLRTQFAKDTTLNL